MKIIKITYNNVEEEVHLDDDLKFGEIEDLQSKFINTSDALKSNVKMDITGYRYAITLACVKKAPWPLNDIIELKGLPRSVGKIVVSEATKLYPLRDCLLEWMATVSGELTDEQMELIEKLTSKST